MGILAGTLLIVACPRAMATPYGFSEGAFTTYVEGSYFNTTKNYDNTSTVVALPGGNKFTEIRTTVLGEYDFTDNFGMFANVGFKSNTSTTGTFDRTNTNFSDGIVGADFLLFNGWLTVIPEIDVAFPMYATPGTDNSVLLGDGAIAGTLKFNINKKFKYVFAHASVGGTYRSQGLSTLIPYDLFAQLNFKSLFLRLGVNGANSINNDQYQNDQYNRLNVTNQWDGGSLIYYAIDPSWTNAAATLGVNFSRSFYMTAGAEQTINGANAAQGTRFLAGIGITFDGGSSPDEDSDASDGFVPEADANTKNFEVDTESEDATIPKTKPARPKVRERTKVVVPR